MTDIRLLLGDCGTIELEENSYDGMICDPPYGLSFMGRDWDRCVPPAATWTHLMRALKPGAHALIFGGTRTFDILGHQLRLAGFEIRDTLCWLYGQGFPKSLNVSKALDRKAGAVREVVGSRTLSGSAAMSTQEKGGTYAANTSSVGRTKDVDITASSTELAKLWEGYGTALKPAFEPVLLVRKPLDGTVAENVTKWGTGALAIDRSRIGRSEDDASGWSQSGSKASENRAMSGANYAREAKPDAESRWPANVLLDEVSAALLDEQSGNRRGGNFPAGGKVSNGADTAYGNFLGNDQESRRMNDKGGASRFFYCSKASRAERDRGLDGEGRESIFMNGTHRRCPSHPEAPVASGENVYTCGCPLAYGAEIERTQGLNTHPTVKPIKLCSYLSGLILPPTEGARLLVPFCGTGSEIIGAREAGWTSITGVEISDEYINIAKKRIG